MVLVYTHLLNLTSFNLHNFINKFYVNENPPPFLFSCFPIKKTNRGPPPTLIPCSCLFFHKNTQEPPFYPFCSYVLMFLLYIIIIIINNNKTSRYVLYILYFIYIQVFRVKNIEHKNIPISCPMPNLVQERKNIYDHLPKPLNFYGLGLAKGQKDKRTI
jgi:hypothetical protein